MTDTFATILNKHEKSDKTQISEDSLFISAIKREFANSEEILKAANARSITAQDFISGKVANLPVIPVRQTDDFYIKKHTKSQVPYFHSHQFYELIYVHKGKCMQQFKNGFKLYMTEKQCSLISPNAVHLIEKNKTLDIVLKLIIPCDLFEQTAGKVLSNKVLEDMIVFDNLSETAEFAILKLLEEEQRENAFKSLILHSYLTIIFTELVNSKKSDIALEMLLNNYFEDNIKTASLSDFATLQNYNANYVSRLIKNKTGKSFSDLLSIYRIDLAKRLLIDSSMTLEDIANEIGYSNTSGLYKQFFSLLGMKPSEYRKLFK